MKKVIAVSGSPGHWNAGESRPYEEALRAAGIEPLVISPGDDIPDGWTGLMLMGGSDVNPALYGETARPETQSPDDARDLMECGFIRDALARDLPLLAICRGVQILNVALGGTLIQHLASSDRHVQRPEDKGQPAHAVEVAAGTLLADIAGTGRLDVNSRHHQAIARVGTGLLVSARDDEDGTIEAVEMPEKRFVVGVQWHPENMSVSDGAQARLFGAFAEALL